jgi:two-component system chemotaxis sensor kinase CheA
MVPISQIFSRFPRLVRDLSKSLDKKINLVIEGEETELDKSVIEDLLDPIMHSVRNSIDHGIESPEERKAAGKPPEGMVLLKAANEGNMIVIEISDDGKGIDVEAVKAKAVERGLISPNKLLTDVEAFNLIFEPGFSTAKQITSISGRGVGLDVVRRQIDKLNGTVKVSSEHGKGTKFTIKLPLTLAIIQGLLVRVGREIYSIPITSVIESLRIKPEDIKMIDNYEVFNIRNDVISLLRLNRLFGIKTEEQQDYNFIVIVGTAEKKMGFMVDSLIGEEDVVIKPLRDQFTNSPGIAGASILGDGSVSLIIDVSQLLELGLRREMESRRIRESSVR